MIHRTVGIAGSLLLFLGVSAQLAYAATTPCPFTWERNLRVGSNGADVLALQEFLGVRQTGYYGTVTAAAVTTFQQTYSTDILLPARLTKGTGTVGSLTRAKLEQLCEQAPASVQTAATTSANVLTVSAANQPQPTLAPAGAGAVPFTSFTLTAGSADVTVNKVTVERTGPGEDSAFADVALNDEDGDQVGDTQSFTSDHKAVFSEPFTVPANTSETFTITGDMADDLSDFDGEMPVVQIDSIDANAPVAGVLPVRGTGQTLNASLIIGEALASLSSMDPGASTNRYIGDTGIVFSGIRITANSVENLTLSGISWDQTGTAASGDLANVETIVDGVPYPISVDDHTYSSTFSPGIVIPKGQAVDVYIRGDLTTTGANRTVEFDIDDSSDVSLTGNTYGFGVGITPSDDTAESGNSVFLTSDGTPDGDQGASFFSGSVVTINPGTLISIHS